MTGGRGHIVYLPVGSACLEHDRSGDEPGCRQTAGRALQGMRGEANFSKIRRGHRRVDVLEPQHAVIEKQLRDRGAQYVEQIRKAATAAGVASEVVMTTSLDPFRGIVDAARKERCDIICMASHGRGQLASVLLGNVTQKVLATSKIPVLVCR